MKIGVKFSSGVDDLPAAHVSSCFLFLEEERGQRWWLCNVTPDYTYTHNLLSILPQWQSSRSRLKESQKDLDTFFWNDRLIVVDAMPYSNGGSKFVHMHYKGSGNQIWSWDAIQRKMYDCCNVFTLNFNILWTWSNVSLGGWLIRLWKTNPCWEKTCWF